MTEVPLYGVGFRVEGVGLRVWSVGCRMQGEEFRVEPRQTLAPHPVTRRYSRLYRLLGYLSHTKQRFPRDLQ